MLLSKHQGLAESIVCSLGFSSKGKPVSLIATGELRSRLIDLASSNAEVEVTGKMCAAGLHVSEMKVLKSTIIDPDVDDD